jgi:hypothetical protein
MEGMMGEGMETENKQGQEEKNEDRKEGRKHRIRGTG